MYTVAIEVRGGCVVGVSSFGAGPQDIQAVLVDYDNIERGDNAGRIEVEQLENDAELSAVVRDALGEEQLCECGRPVSKCATYDDPALDHGDRE